MQKYLIIFILGFFSCSTADERDSMKRMKNNLSVEKIYRLSTEKVYVEEPLELATRELYPWENETEFAKITMNTLRCRGSRDAKLRKAGAKEFEDCGGLHDHGLPYRDGEEFVFSALITMLNKLQKSFDKKVVVTTGHRCPKHHTYITKGSSKISRYMIGCKADFFIEGMEDQPEEIVQRVMDLCEDVKFQKIQNKDGTVSWMSREFRITINQEGEHSILDGKKHSVVTLDVRFDRQKKKSIILDWKQAYNGYIRH